MHAAVETEVDSGAVDQVSARRAEIETQFLRMARRAEAEDESEFEPDDFKEPR